MAVTLGPIYPCPECGCLVQKASRGYGRESIEDVRSGQRHDCRKFSPQPERQIRECSLCFEHYDATLLDPRGNRWSEHGCPPRPKYEPPKTTQVAPIPGPVKVEMAKLDVTDTASKPLRLDPRYG